MSDPDPPVGEPREPPDGLPAVLDAADDPRLAADHVRTVPRDGDAGTAVVVGVVHGHPASVHRVRRVAELVDPDVLALELPAVAVPLFERLAGEGRGDRGGEMSAAIAAAGGAAVVGVDMPSRDSLRRLLSKVRAAGPSPRELRAVCGQVASVTGHALRCRLAALVGDRAAGATPVAPACTHGCGPDDPPAAQAADERRHLSRSRSLLGAIEPPASMRLTDEAREESMAAALGRLRADGDVLAVVGHHHLDAVAGRLASVE